MYQDITNAAITASCFLLFYMGAEWLVERYWLMIVVSLLDFYMCEQAVKRQALTGGCPLGNIWAYGIKSVSVAIICLGAVSQCSTFPANMSVVLMVLSVFTSTLLVYLSKNPEISKAAFR